MKKKFLLTIAMSAIVFATSQAQEFRYGLSGGYNLNSMIANESKSGFHAGLKGEYAFRDAQKGLYTDFGLMISSYGWKSTPAYENETGKVLEWDTTPYYLNIPIHLGYKFKVNDNLSIFVNAGITRLHIQTAKRKQEYHQTICSKTDSHHASTGE